MTLNEAIDKYSIPIPSDIYKYNKEKYKEFDEVYLRSFYSTFYTRDITNEENESKGKKKIAIVLGGQTGAGKSALVAETKREFKREKRQIALIDDDAYRKLYTYAEDILQECPEYYTLITAIASSKVTPKIMQFAAQNGYNFIFDGTMKNSRIIETMKTWKDYEIDVKIMAACRLRSLASIATRNAELRKMGEARFISNEAHDATYYGIPDTLRILEESKLATRIGIYTRGIDPIYPVRRHLTVKDSQEMNVAEKLEQLRKEDEVEFLRTADREIEYLNSLAQDLTKDERKEIYEVISMIKERIKEVGQEER